jgi:3-carboxy-cis,cis-muconate cycloisomerase
MSFSALDSRLTGPLFAPAALAEAFCDTARLAALLRVEWALAEAQHQQGLVPAEVAKAIAALSPADFDLETLGAATALSGVPTIPFVSALRRLVPKDCEAFVHKGATTQDILDTALVLQLQNALDRLLADLRSLLPALTELATREAATPCVGRTYGQHAAPVSFGFKVAVWLAGLCDVLEGLPALRKQALKASLAGPVGTLSGRSDKDRRVAESFADLLSLHHDPLPWHVRRAGLAGLAAWLGQLIGALAKCAEDIVFLASTEVAEVAEPFIKGRGGSSAMPHKRNPVSATLILAAQKQAPFLVATQLSCMNGAHERPAGAWHAEWTVLPQLFGLAAGAVREALTLARGLEVDRVRMLHNLDATQGLIFADAVAALLSRTIGADKAHHLVAQGADRVRETRQALPAVLPALPDWPQDVDAASLNACFDITPAVQAAASFVPIAAARAQHILALCH